MRRKTTIALLIVAGVVVGGIGATAGTLKLSENPAFCNSVCHIMDPYYESYTSATLDYMAYRHAQKGVICKDCHHTDLPKQIQEVVVYVKGEAPEPLKMRRVENKDCYACKEHATYAQVVESTADLQPNPHSPKSESVRCQFCHRNHRP